MKPTKYRLLIGSLYFNYIFQGMAAIILSQNMTELKKSMASKYHASHSSNECNWFWKNP